MEDPLDKLDFQKYFKAVDAVKTVRPEGRITQVVGLIAEGDSLGLGIGGICSIINNQGQEIKAEVVSKDERESGLRKVLNFGHTLGHAIESAGDFSLPHGSCVALGMILEARLGEKMEVTREGTSARLRKMADLLDLPTEVPADLSPETILEYTRSDKKGRGGRPQYVLLSQAGKVFPARDWAQDAPDETVLEVLREGGASI